MSKGKVIRVQEKGQVTLPAEVRRRLGIKKGDLLSVIETDDGVLIRPQSGVDRQTLPSIRETLAEQGITLEELLSLEPTASGIPLREFTADEVATFIHDDQLTDQQRATIEHVGRISGH